MTTETVNEVLSFPFGETPREVIVERLAAFQETVRPTFAHPILYRNTDPDDLLTVLDMAALTAEPAQQDNQYLTVPVELQRRARKLHISILAALGINESNTL